MSEWKKVEEPVGEPTAEAAAEENTQPPAELPEESSESGQEGSHELASVPEEGQKEEDAEAQDAKSGGAAPAVSGRYTASGRRRGRRRYAAPLGLVVILLALVGVVSLVVAGVQAIQRATDDTELKAELFDFLEPVLANYPITPFEDVREDSQDALVLSAIWKITDAEQIRMLREEDENSRYPIDDNGRLIIPVEEVEEAYHELFGDDAQPTHKAAIGGDAGGSFTFEYIESEQAYHVPFALESAYQPVADTLTKSGGRYTLRVGFVLVQDIGIDENGDTITPMPDMAQYKQDYTLEKTDTGWKLVAVADVA